MKIINLRYLRFAEASGDDITVEITSTVSDAVSKLDELINKLSSLESAVNKSTSTIKKLSNGVSDNTQKIKENKNAVNDTNNGWKSFAKSLTGTFVRFRIISGTIKGIGSSLLSVVDSAADYEESINLYTSSLGNYADKGVEWATRISDALYLDPTNIYQYEGALNSLIRGLGVTADNAYLMSTNLTQLVYDMSSYLNIDIDAAYAKIQSAMSGQSRAVASVGIALNDASLQQLAYRLGIEKSTKSMTQSEKTYLRYIQLMKQSVLMQGDLGRTLMTPSNALRLVKQQFTLLGRAIGRVFIPIIVSAIPYVMALTNVLTVLANKLASMLGYEITDIDYSSLGELEDYIGGVGEKADSTGSKVKNMLAPFDDLNVVASKSSGTGGGVPSDTIDFTKYLTGYDMLAGLTDEFAEKAKDAEGKVNLLLKAIGGFLAALALTKLIKFISGFKSLGSAITKEDGLFLTLGKTVSHFFTNFSKGYKDVISKGGSVISALSGGARAVIGVFGQVTIGVASFVAAGIAGYDAFNKLVLGEKSASSAFVEFIGVVGTAATVAALFISPWAGAAVVIAGVSGALIGVYNAYRDLQQEEEFQRKYDDLFDGQGVSLGILKQELNNTFENLKKYNETTDDLNKKTTDAKNSVDDAVKSIQNLNSDLENGKYESNAEKISLIKKAYENLGESIKTADQKEQDRQIAQLNRLLEEGRITKDIYDKNVKSLKEYTNLRAAEANGYTKELADLNAKLSTHKITQDEYNKEVEKLASKYALVSDEGKNLGLNLASLYEVSKDGFDLKNPEKFNASLKDLQKEYKKLSKDTTDTYNESHLLNEKQIKNYDVQLAKLKLLGKDGSNEYKNLQETRNNLYNQDLQLTQQYEKDMNSIGGTFKEIMLTMMAQIDAAGLESNKNMKDTVKDIKSNIRDLADYNIDYSEIHIFDSFITNGKKTFGKFNQDQISEFEKYGVSFSDSMINSLLNQTEKNLKQKKEREKELFSNEYNDLGKAIPDGLKKGINEKSHLVTDSIGTMCTDAELKYRSLTDTHSPSRLYEKFGGWLVEGLSNGINGNSNIVVSSISSLSNKMMDTMNKTKLSFSINTSVESSFNSILSKLQSFCNKWRDAINDLAKHTKSTMNGIKVDKSGKVSYTSMPKINVEKFEDGGYPKSGDLFFANENGVPEYITSIGNRSAVANQDQMVSALSGAIITAMSRIPMNSSQPGNTVVYIGNDKVYEGQGKYQNRQSDRYGTNYIKI